MAKKSSQKRKDYVVTVTDGKKIEKIELSARGKRMARSKALVQAGLGFTIKYCEIAKEFFYNERIRLQKRL